MKDPEEVNIRNVHLLEMNKCTPFRNEWESLVGCGNLMISFCTFWISSLVGGYLPCSNSLVDRGQYPVMLHN